MYLSCDGKYLLLKPLIITPATNSRPLMIISLIDLRRLYGHDLQADIVLCRFPAIHLLQALGSLFFLCFFFFFLSFLCSFLSSFSSHLSRFSKSSSPEPEDEVNCGV